MDGLIKVDFSADRLTVSARDLHGFLEVNTPYHKWFPRMCEYGFTEGADFWTFLSESTGGRPGGDAALTIDMAKEICMLQRNEKGKQARQYFIQLEKDWNSPEKVMARALKIADVKIKGLEADNAALQAQIAADAPKVIFAGAVSVSSDTILIGELAKILKQNGVPNMGQNRLFERLREEHYLISREGANYNMPTQRAMEMGLFAIKETTIARGDGRPKIAATVKVTGKGQIYFVNHFLRKDAAPVAEGAT